MPNDLVLHSPVGADAVSFKWPLLSGDKQEGATEIVDTIRYISDDIPELKHALRTKPLSDYDVTSYNSIRELVTKYNQAIDFILLEKGDSELEEQRNRRASPQVLKHILQQVYSSAIDEPEKLNQYPPFSPEVYGETSFELIQQMIDKVTVSEGDTFIDLGSGVGQVVLQMAAMTPCKKCVGIEKAERPAMYAKEMDRHFRRWMAFYGKTYGHYEITKGDFLKEEHSEDIKRSSLVFVNNFAFGPDVDHKLKLIFMDLQEGARIVSSKAFCQRHSRITNRSLSDIGTMLDVEEMKPLGGSVSWTDTPVTYFIHVVNREKLANYFSSKKEVSKAKHKMKKDTSKNSQRASDSDSASNSKDSSDSQPGPTTRRAWNDYCNSSQQSSKNSLSDEENLDNNNGKEENAVGPTTRRAWISYCSNQALNINTLSEEERNTDDNVDFLSFTAKSKEKKPMKRKIPRPKQAPPPPSPRVLRPKPALINHNAIATALTASPPLSRETSPVPPRQTKSRKNRKTKAKKNKKPILGLDILHSQTLGSLSSVGDNEPPPPAPGCVDLKLDSVLNIQAQKEAEEVKVEAKEEVEEEPLTPAETALPPKVVKNVEEYCNKYKNAILEYLQKMMTDDYKTMILNNIVKEKARKNSLDLRSKQLSKQIDELNLKSVKLLRDHLADFNASSPAELMASARSIVKRQKELRAQFARLNSELEGLEEKRKKLERLWENEVVEIYKRQGNPLLNGVTLTTPGYSNNVAIKSEVVAPKEKELTITRPTKEKRRNQDLASIANMPKIEEQNPDALAKKILALEHNRQLEQSRIENKTGTTTQVLTVDTGDHLNKALLARGKRKGKTVSETPRADDFQERLKSIITSVLKEGDGNSVPITTIASASVYYSKPSTTTTTTPIYSSALDLKSVNLGLKIEQNPVSSYSQGIPDYTQMSPAKVALKRHLSTQDAKSTEKWESKNRGSASFVRVTEHTSTDSEKTQTVEITSQSIINAAVDMSYNTAPKLGGVPLPNSYSPISRPSSAEAPEQPAERKQEQQHGLAARLDSILDARIPTTSYSQSSSSSSTSRYQYSEVKTEVTATMVTATTTAIKKEQSTQQDLPVEGLAAIFQDRFAPQVEDAGPISPPEVDIKEKYLNIKTEKKSEEKEDGTENSGKKWKDRINFGFDKLVAFASEVDKRRKSTETGSGGGAPGNMSPPNTEARGSVRGTLALKFKGIHKSEEGAEPSAYGPESMKTFISEEIPSKIKRTMSECDVSSERRHWTETIKPPTSEKEALKKRKSDFASIATSKRNYLETRPPDITRPIKSDAGPSSMDVKSEGGVSQSRVNVPGEDRKGVMPRNQESLLPRCLPISQPETLMQDSYEHHFKKKYFHARNQRSGPPPANTVIEQGHYPSNSWSSYQAAPQRNHVPVSLMSSRPTSSLAYRRAQQGSDKSVYTPYSTYVRTPKYRAGNSFYTPQAPHTHFQGMRVPQQQRPSAYEHT